MDVEHWQANAAKEIQSLRQSISEGEMAMGDMPHLEEIVAIINKYFQMWRSYHQEH